MTAIESGIIIQSLFSNTLQMQNFPMQFQQKDLPHRQIPGGCVQKVPSPSQYLFLCKHYTASYLHIQH